MGIEEVEMEGRGVSLGLLKIGHGRQEGAWGHYNKKGKYKACLRNLEKSSLAVT